MSLYEWEDCLQWKCDKCGFSVEFPPNDFWAGVSELKSRGWGFSRDDEGGWSHYCSKCRKSPAEILAMTIPARRRATEVK
jgi:hypothetical protein